MKQTENNIVPMPDRPVNLPENIYWLSGEGCGSWFHIEAHDEYYAISRFSPEGKLECAGLFEQVSGNAFKLKEKFAFTYLSHCAEVNILQENEKRKFKLVRRC